MSEEIKNPLHPADTNGDGVVSSEEHKMYLEFKRKELWYGKSSKSYR